jgi:Ras-related GTP-binding protein C/D
VGRIFDRGIHARCIGKSNRRLARRSDRVDRISVHSQQDTHHPISKIVPTFILAYAQNPNINFEVFIHKADHWDADWQDEDFREITGRVMDEIADFGDWASLADSHPNARFPNLEDSDVWLDTLTTQQTRFWLTSIHNYTIYEAWSKVIQRLMEDIYGTIEGLLNTFGQVSQ